jgi:hypothetical protein
MIAKHEENVEFVKAQEKEENGQASRVLVAIKLSNGFANDRRSNNGAFFS